MTGGEEGPLAPRCVCVCVCVCVCERERERERERETGTRMGLLVGSLLVDVIGDSQVTMERCRHLWSPGSVNTCIWRPG